MVGELARSANRRNNGEEAERVYPCCDCDDSQAYGRGQQHQKAQLFANGDAHLGHVTGRRRQQNLSKARVRAKKVVCIPFLAVPVPEIWMGIRAAGVVVR